MNTTLLATCDRILAKLPFSDTESDVVGGIIVPKSTLNQMKAKTYVELEIVSAGPDCKVARTGDRVIVNNNVCSPIEWDGTQYMVFSEVTAFAVIRTPASSVTPLERFDAPQLEQTPS